MRWPRGAVGSPLSLHPHNAGSGCLGFKARLGRIPPSPPPRPRSLPRRPNLGVSPPPSSWHQASTPSWSQSSMRLQTPLHTSTPKGPSVFVFDVGINWSLGPVYTSLLDYLIDYRSRVASQRRALAAHATKRRRCPRMRVSCPHVFPRLRRVIGPSESGWSHLDS